MIGETLSHFEITAKLGEGGMGEVYRAEDTKLGRAVAIKVLPPAFTDDAERLARFEREAKVLASLHHPNIAGIFQILEAEGQQLLVMELVEGDDLAERLERGPVGVEEASAIALQVAQGLEAAHERGVVHRDLKPANIKVTPDGQVKILDFGLAKAWEEPPEEGSLSMSPTLTAQMTQAGVILGTAAYMSPEQAKGRPADKRADIWSFGIVLWEMLTGRRLFTGDSVSDTLAAVLRDDIDDSDLPDDTPASLRALLHRCLDRDPKTRLRDIGEARILLAEIVADPEAAAASTRPVPAGPSDVASHARARRRVTTAAALVAVALASAATTWILTGDREPTVSGDTPPAAVHFTIGNADGGPLPEIGELLISPDGQWVAYAGGSYESEGLVVGGDHTDEPLRVRALDSFDASTRVLEGTEGALYPFASPDSEWIGFFRGGGGVRTLYRVNVRSGSVLPITTDPRPGYQADWSENGTLVLGAQRSGLRRIDVDTGAIRESLTQVDSAGGEVGHVNPEILPNGRGVLFTALGGNESAPRVRVWDARSGEIGTVLPRGGRARYLASGQLVYVADGNLLVVGFDLETLTTVGEPRVVVQGVAHSRLGNAYFDVSRDGTLAYLPGSARLPRVFSLVWTRPDGTVERDLVEGDVQHPQVSRDGRRWLARTSSSELAVFEEGAPLPKRFPTEIPLAAPPLLTDDNSAALYGNPNLTAGTRLFRLDLTSGISTPVTRLQNDKQLPVALDAARGEMLALVVRTTDEGVLDSDLVVADLEGEAPDRELLVGPDRVTGARLSPQGDRLAYSILADPVTLASTLYVSDYPAMNRRLPISESMVDNGYAWGPDGRLWFVDRTDRAMRAVSFSEDDGLGVSAIDVAFALPAGFWPERGFAIAPDGRLLMIRGGSRSQEQGAPSGKIHVIVDWAGQNQLGTEPGS